MEGDRFGTVGGGAGSFRPLILIAVLGIFVPFRMGPETIL